jgi:serine/threonine protein phosphatase 1
LRQIVISDIHGCAAELDQLLQKTNAQPEEVIFLGDYVDSGPNSMGVLETVQEWCGQGATALLGNHDDLFLQWLEDREDIFYYGRVGGMATIYNCLTRLGEDNVEYSQLMNNLVVENKTKQTIKDSFQTQISFLQSLPLYKQEPGTLFVHAGINPRKGLEKTRRDDFLNIRHEFIDYYNGEDMIIFGHTQTKKLHGSNQVYFGANRIIGVDGGCAFGGQLNALIIEEGEFTTTEVQKIAEKK